MHGDTLDGGVTSQCAAGAAGSAWLACCQRCWGRCEWAERATCASPCHSGARTPPGTGGVPGSAGHPTSGASTTCSWHPGSRDVPVRPLAYASHLISSHHISGSMQLSWLHDLAACSSASCITCLGRAPEWGWACQLICVCQTRSDAIQYNGAVLLRTLDCCAILREVQNQNKAL